MLYCKRESNIFLRYFLFGYSKIYVMREDRRPNTPDTLSLLTFIMSTNIVNVQVGRFGPHIV